ncbi:hypothetical protein H9636_00480 [Ureibacillus sp. Re31]|uniref:Branched-chain amino acid aminotransferase n=1 Tax=Ureibacillus galli TaxID=2762222 RepID=A0ABR8X750_9BACL|nr:hypothetical protein [Ureibacillus galli]MBD8025119.1 hypothetical protein [Ureibacillus galli]
MELTDVYIERCDKDSEELISNENQTFLTTSIQHLKQNMNEFLYIESPTFENIKTDALSFEVDDVFKTYMVLLGFKVQKKHADGIKRYLTEHLHGENAFYSCSFSGEEGLWELNIPIDFMDGFHENQSIEQVLSITYHFLEQLSKSIAQQ